MINNVSQTNRSTLITFSTGIYNKCCHLNSIMVHPGPVQPLFKLNSINFLKKKIYSKFVYDIKCCQHYDQA